MEIPLVSTEDAPEPPRDMRIRSVEIIPQADGRRVRVSVTVTAFLEAPTIEIELIGPAGEVVSGATIVESAQARSSVTLHLRGERHPGVYQARVRLEYPDVGDVDVRAVDFVLAGAESAGGSG